MKIREKNISSVTYIALMTIVNKTSLNLKELNTNRVEFNSGHGFSL